jgi:hypothetical protein
MSVCQSLTLPGDNRPNQIFLAMGNGDLRTYDIACMRKSPYAIHNMWQIHEEQSLKSGLSPIPLRNPSVLNKFFTYFLKLTRFRKPQAAEILPHPRDLGLVFIAYDGEDKLLVVFRKVIQVIVSWCRFVGPGK